MKDERIVIETEKLKKGHESIVKVVSMTHILYFSEVFMKNRFKFK